MSLIRVGKLYKTHGLQGEIKLYPESDDVASLYALKTLHIGKSEKRALPYEVKSWRSQTAKGHFFLLVKLKDIQSIEQAEALQNLQVFAEEQEISIDDDEYFIHDIIGATALDEAGNQLGIIKDYVELPTYFAFQIERPELPDALIPDIDVFVISVHPEDKKVIFNPIEGML